MKTCDYCGCEIPKGTEHEILDENFNKTNSYQCEKCWTEEMDAKYSEEN